LIYSPVSRNEQSSLGVGVCLDLAFKALPVFASGDSFTGFDVLYRIFILGVQNLPSPCTWHCALSWLETYVSWLMWAQVNGSMIAQS